MSPLLPPSSPIMTSFNMQTLSELSLQSLDSPNDEK